MKQKRIWNGCVMQAAAILVAAAFLLSFPVSSFAETAEKPEKPVLVAHGGGAVDGFETTNSEEAVLKAIKEGFQLIELDMDFSKDGKIIMIHDWDRTAVHYYGKPFTRKLNANEFEKIPVAGQFHTLTFETLLPILDSAPDVRIITDTKEDNLHLLSAIAERYPAYVSRMIPQIYDYDEYEQVEALGYENIILTLYAMPKIDFEELLSFAQSRELYAVTVGDGYDSVIKDLEKKLAAEGITVYYHPLSDYEEAQALLAAGVTGIYTSTLLPDEFVRPGSQYFLLDQRKRLGDRTLSEKSLEVIRSLWIKNGAGKEIEYAIDGEEATETLVRELPDGEHALTVEVGEDETTLATLTYVLWAEEDSLRILDPKYAYRLTDFINIPDLQETLQAVGTPEETTLLLQNALILKAGACYGYCGGEALRFSVKGETLYAQRDRSGTLLAPLAECAKALGAESVSMDEGRYIYVVADGVRTIMQAGTTYYNQNGKSGRFETPLAIYRAKAMASGEMLALLFDRQPISQDDLLILLPGNTELTAPEKAEIFKAATDLFDAKE